ncbi:uncharacterized protein LOC120916262 [Rana temporaria]|uniref:uncharacterized protein LOC120916262 n=1 Tax=Rana temporaria TaxID=8407 RepID=UPI001AAD869E|nr:uncharacterized protein LOC120916262 [Rana temporaria]XP_040183071.1 uncharacterized protein LOC120916262 [Rana temporaria]
MAKEPLSKPVQETGSNNQTVKDLPQGVSEVSTAEKSTIIEEIGSDKEETPPVEENDGLPKERATSSGVEDGPPPIIKVSVETQTETEFSEQSSEVNPEPEVEKESAIKATSAQTPLEGKDQLPPGRDVKGKKKKQRQKKKRPSKEKNEAQPSLSRDNTQSWSIASQLPLKSGITLRLVCPLVCLLCVIGVTQCFSVDNVKEECHVYSVVAQSSITNQKLTIKKGKQFLCEISVSQNEVPCGKSSVLPINETSLHLTTKEKSDSYFVEAGDMETLTFKYEGSCGDRESSLKHINPEEAQTTPSVPNENPPVPHTAEEMPGWAIFLIVLLGLAAIAGVLYRFRGRLCRRNCWNRQPQDNPAEREPMGSSQVGKKPRCFCVGCPHYMNCEDAAPNIEMTS